MCTAKSPDAGYGQHGTVHTRFDRFTTLSELAWGLYQLLEIAELVRDAGRCIGDVRARELWLHPGGSVARERKGVRAPVGAVRDRLSAVVHERCWNRVTGTGGLLPLGHDAGCHLMGVPERVLLRIVRANRGLPGRVLIAEAVTQGVQDAREASVGYQRALAEWQRIHGPVRALEFVNQQLTEIVDLRDPYLEESGSSRDWGRDRTGPRTV